MQVLGIDAGGSKTVALLADGEGRVVGEGRAGGANLQAHGELEVEKVLHAVIDQATTNRGALDAVCLGLAGVDREGDLAVIRDIMRRLGFKERALIVNDALIALVAGAGQGPGLVLVSGTGSIAYGVSARGVAARAGGWGSALGDEGSGYWIGRRALTAVTKAADGRGPATMLSALVLRHFSLSRPEQLVTEIYDHARGRQSIATLGAVVEHARAADVAVSRLTSTDAPTMQSSATITARKPVPWPGTTRRWPRTTTNWRSSRSALYARECCASTWDAKGACRLRRADSVGAGHPGRGRHQPL